MCLKLLQDREREENYDEAHAALLWATEFYIYILQLLIWQSRDKNITSHGSVSLKSLLLTLCMPTYIMVKKKIRRNLSYLDLLDKTFLMVMRRYLMHFSFHNILILHNIKVHTL